jgi:hypothetical protein
VLRQIKSALGLKLTQDEFADEVIEFLKKNGITQPLSYDAPQFSIHVVGDDGARANTYFLGNAYKEFGSTPPWRRQPILQAYFNSHEPMPDSLESARDKIFPRLQQRAFYDEMPLRALVGQIPGAQEGGQLTFPHMLVAEHFAEGYVYDTPKTVMHINDQRAAEWKLNEEALHAIGMENLTKATTRPFTSMAPGVFISDYGDSHDATRLLLRERVAECRVQGRLIAMPCNRDTLVITGEDDINGLSIMCNVAEQALKQPRAMTMIPLVLAGGTWREWTVPANHQLKNRFKYLRVMSLSELYGSQRQLQNEYNQSKGIDLFVCDYMALQNAEGDVLSVAAWTEGVVSLLPEVDEITFVHIAGENDGSVVCQAPWAAAQKVVGHLMIKQTIYPPRYRVDSFPSADELEQLKKLSSH